MRMVGAWAVGQRLRRERELTRNEGRQRNAGGDGLSCVVRIILARVVIPSVVVEDEPGAQLISLAQKAGGWKLEGIF